MRIAERIEIVEGVHPDMNAVELAGKYDAIAHIEMVEEGHPDMGAIELAGKYDAVRYVEIVESVLRCVRV